MSAIINKLQFIKNIKHLFKTMIITVFLTNKKTNSSKLNSLISRFFAFYIINQILFLINDFLKTLYKCLLQKIFGFC